jgi:hypothetical protein
MFSLFKKDTIIRELEKENAALKLQVNSLLADIAQFNNEALAATPYIDFDTMRVFSIERQLREHGIPETIIGYYMDKPVISHDGEMIIHRDVVKEWVLYCNTQRHEELIKQFIEWKAKK